MLPCLIRNPSHPFESLICRFLGHLVPTPVRRALAPLISKASKCCASRLLKNPFLMSEKKQCGYPCWPTRQRILPPPSPPRSSLHFLRLLFCTFSNSQGFRTLCPRFYCVAPCRNLLPTSDINESRAPALFASPRDTPPTRGPHRRFTMEFSSFLSPCPPDPSQCPLMSNFGHQILLFSPSWILKMSPQPLRPFNPNRADAPGLFGYLSASDSCWALRPDVETTS